MSGFPIMYYVGALRVETFGDDEDINNNDDTDDRSKITRKGLAITY